jgi:hypothetical protein
MKFLQAHCLGYNRKGLRMNEARILEERDLKMRKSFSKVVGKVETRSLAPYRIPANLKGHIDFITGRYFTRMSVLPPPVPPSKS